MSDRDRQADSEASASGLRKADAVRDRRLLAVSLLLVAGVFSGVVVGVMMTAHFAAEGDPPPNTAALQSMQLLLQEYPDSQELKQAIREEDRTARQAYFTRRRIMAGGAFLLLAGLIATLLCARWYASLDPRLPVPKRVSERAGAEAWLQARKRSMAAVLVAASVLFAALLVATFTRPWPFPRAEPTLRAGADREVTGTGPPLPSGADVSFKENWPRFRGSSGMGIVEAGDWPRSWDAAAGRNILWKTPIPASGKSSPVIWGNRIFLTGGDEKTREVFCYERASGRLLWRRGVAPAAQASAGTDEEDQLEVFDETGYAAPTPVTDGRRVYAFFATADVAALSFEGEVVWSRNLGKPENMYGIATSPVVHEGRLVIQFDRGYSAEGGLSALLALDVNTGEEVWRAEREVPVSWSTAVLVRTEGGPELVTCANPWVIAYDPELGTELWRAEVLAGDVAASPVFANGVVFATNQSAQVAAIRAGGIGDVTTTHVAWTAEEGMSDASSPICDGRLFLQANSSGQVTCYGAEDGALVWEHQFDCSFWASPTLVGKLVYLPGENGTTYVFPLSDTFELLGTANVGEPVYATPAFADSRIYIRAENHLFCVGKR